MLFLESNLLTLLMLNTSLPFHLSKNTFLAVLDKTNIHAKLQCYKTEL
jgi:hypothetical protein